MGHMSTLENLTGLVFFRGPRSELRNGSPHPDRRAADASEGATRNDWDKPSNSFGEGKMCLVNVNYAVKKILE